MSTVELGNLIDDEVKRDAVHVAIVPATAGRQLHPGDHVGIYSDGDELIADNGRTAVGIVDPFLRKPVDKGVCFWVLMYPGTVKDLRHNWSHQDLPDDDVEYREPEYEDDGSGCRGC
jgi:hypothetical protein